MSKFITKIVALERRNKEGSVIKSGESVAIPDDDAAMLEPISDTAVEMGLLENPVTKAPYTIAEFREKQKEITAMFKMREAEANRRRAVM